MKYIVSFLLVVLAFSFCMAIAKDYTLYKQNEIGIASKVEPPAPPAQFSTRLKPLPTPAPTPTAPPSVTPPPEPPASPPPKPAFPVLHETPEDEEPEETEDDEENSEPDSYYDSYSSTQNEISREIMNAFGHEWKIALAIAKAESSLNPQAVNRNSNGTRDIGIFQINDLHGWSAEERYDWKNNIAIAKEIRDRCGWSAWSVYNNQQYRRFL